VRTAAQSSQRYRRFTWLVWAGVAFFLAIVAGSYAVLHWYAYSTYYLGNDNSTIAVYQGQPSGVLWFKPLKVVDTQYSSAQLRVADQIDLGATISEPTLEAALQYAANLHNEWKKTQTTATTTTVAGATTTLKRG